MSNELVPVGRRLGTYDPNWRERHDAAMKAFDTHKDPDDILENLRLQGEVHAAFHAQFATAGDYRDWLFRNLKRDAELAGHVLVLPRLFPDFDVDDVNSAYQEAMDMRRAQEAHERQKRSIGQPEGMTAFNTPQAANTERHIIRVRYAGFTGAIQTNECKMMVELGERASICFSAITAEGTSPTNAMDELTETAYQRIARPRGYAPGQVDFFNHLSSVVYSEWRQPERLQCLGFSLVGEKPIWAFGSGEVMSRVPTAVCNLPYEQTDKFMDFTQPGPAMKPQRSQVSTGLFQRILRLGR